jgi:predicted negative regulator of RcsB-dependent stress response
MGRRITRKQLKQDEFVTVADTVFQWLRENWRPIVGVAGGLMVVYLIWGLASWWSADRAQDAAVHLDQALRAIDDEEAGAPTSGTEVLSGEEQLQQVIEEHGGTTQGDMARLVLARKHLDGGRTDEARELLVRLSQRHKGDTIGRLAAFDLIQLRISSGQGAEVAQELEAMVAGQDDSLPRDMALHELGMLLVKEQRTDEGRDYLEKLVEEFPDSPYRSSASQKLSELG